MNWRFFGREEIESYHHRNTTFYFLYERTSRTKLVSEQFFRITIIMLLLLIFSSLNIANDDCFSTFSELEIRQFEKSNFVHKTKLIETIRESKKLKGSSSLKYNTPRYSKNYKPTRLNRILDETNSNLGLNRTNGNFTKVKTCFSYIPISFDIHVNLENYTSILDCGSTTENACKDMSAAMVSLSSISTREGRKGECFEILFNIILMTDLADLDRSGGRACLARVPPIDGSIRQFIRVNVLVKSFDNASPRLIRCFYDTDGFITDSSSVISYIRFHNMKAINMVTPCMEASNVDFYQVKIFSSMDYRFRLSNSRIIGSVIEMNYGNIEMENCVTDSDIMIMGAERVLFNRTKFSAKLDVDSAGPTILVAHAESVEFSYCQFEFSKNSQLTLRSVVQADINHCNFTYVPLRNHIRKNPKEDAGDPAELSAIKANLVFRIFITKCNFSGKREYGWIDWISVGTVNFVRSAFIDNYSMNAKSVVSLYLCQEVKVVDCFFQQNKAKHSGAILIDSSDVVVVKNSRFFNNTSFKSGGSISLLSVSTSSCILGSRFINNTAKNGNGGAVLMDGNYAVRIESTLFHSNNSTLAGGALYIRNTTLAASLLLTSFVNNRIVLSPAEEQRFKSGHFVEGSGGALSLINTHGFMTKSTFLLNSALRGGACFTNGKNIGIYSPMMEENSAFIGGGIFIEGYAFIENMPDVQYNSADQYGNDIATSIRQYNLSLDRLELKSDDTYESIYVYPGQVVSAYFSQMTDGVNNNVPVLLESAIIEINDTLSSSNFDVHVNQTNFSNIVGFHISLKKESIDLKKDNYFFLKLRLPFATTKFVRVHLVPCKVDYIIKDGLCQLGFPYSQVIPVIVVASILVMIIGIVIGSCTCSFLAFSIWRVYKKIKKVYVREKSEKEIEEKLLTYDVSYSDYGSLHSVDIEKNANYIIPANELKFEKKIGEGASGSVYQAKWNMMDVAVKTIVRKEGSNDMFEKEVMVLIQLRHVNIISFYGICISETQSYMVVELAQNGSMERLIKNMKKGTVKKTLKEKLKILIGIANGMKYLHGLQPNYLIHRDLKPANIILDYNDNPKVCDFGLSRTVSNHTLTTSLTANIGTLLYMCPELILEEDNEQTSSALSKENAKKIDVYAYAIIMWELFFEETPYWNDTCEKINYFNHVSLDQKKIKAFNLLFFVANQEKRPIIPFVDWNEMTTWCEKFLREMNPRNAHQLLSAVDGYVNIMKMSWATEPSARPSFEIIMNMLTDLYEMDF
ncbi:tyrosine kinase [Naegleria gruberi]|uniref:Tyrosine kinase n=1 Tax=Naegleria gruberi TaxID=5762 RepID=D2VC81_NAEGR|nr:tyrosine kinase [Naegleria gruberi]EFC45703.1 tyrosine kinase [Naegleria gruberi]|eukprot:XP_002678447.1 tyrosine kinase [Naegleria gruberi strain NEG-M]